MGDECEGRSREVGNELDNEAEVLYLAELLLVLEYQPARSLVKDVVVVVIARESPCKATSLNKLYRGHILYPSDVKIRISLTQKQMTGS